MSLRLFLPLASRERAIRRPSPCGRALIQARRSSCLEPLRACDPRFWWRLACESGRLLGCEPRVRAR